MSAHFGLAIVELRGRLATLGAMRPSRELASADCGAKLNEIFAHAASFSRVQLARMVNKSKSLYSTRICRLLGLLKWSFYLLCTSQPDRSSG